MEEIYIFLKKIKVCRSQNFVGNRNQHPVRFHLRCLLEMKNGPSSLPLRTCGQKQIVDGSAIGITFAFPFSLRFHKAKLCNVFLDVI
jgi:hypothetical protein